MHRLALKQDFTGIRPDRTRQRLDERRFSGAVVTNDGKDLARIKVEIRAIQRHDIAVAFDQIARLKDRLAHDVTFLIHWSMATATMIRTPIIR